MAVAKAAASVTARFWALRSRMDGSFRLLLEII
jgi:hypothetical protein